MSRLVLLLPNDGCLTIARAVGRRGVEVQALTTDEYAYVLRSRYVTGGRVMPDIRREPEAWVAQLNASGRRGADQRFGRGHRVAGRPPRRSSARG